MFFQFLRENPQTIEPLLAALARMIRRLTETVTDLTLLDLEGRLAKKDRRDASRVAFDGRLDHHVGSREVAARASRRVIVDLHRQRDRREGAVTPQRDSVERAYCDRRRLAGGWGGGGRPG